MAGDLPCLFDKKNKPNRVVFSELLFLASTSWLHGPSVRVRRESDVGSHDIITSPLLSQIYNNLARCDKIK